MNDTIQIRSWATTNTTKYKGISRFQKFICKTFSIPLPVEKCFFEAVVSFSNPEKVRKNDVLLIPNGNGCWMVISNEYYPFFVISSLDALAEDPKYAGDTCVIASAFAERESV